MNNPFLNHDSTLNIKAIRNEFPALHQEVQGHPLVYLDNASTTFKPKSVIKAVNDHYKLETSNIHRGVHYLSELASDKYQKARLKVAKFIGAQDVEHGEEIVFTRGTTESINLVAHSYGRNFLKKGDEILLTHMEHHSNILPWQQLAEEKGLVIKVAPINDKGELIWEEFLNLLGPKTKLLAAVHISNSLGTINPIKKMISEAKKVGAVVLIDGAQSVAHAPVDVQDLDCDFFVFSGHKLMGPTGIGILYGKKELLNKMPPYQTGGGMIQMVSFERSTFAPPPYRFEAGTPHISGAIGLGAAVDFLTTIGMENIFDYESKLLDSATERLKNLPGIRLIGKADQKASIISFVIDGIHPHDVGTMADIEGVALRTGHHCTQPLMKFFDVPATIRASFSFYNTEDEIDSLHRALIKLGTFFL